MIVQSVQPTTIPVCGTLQSTLLDTPQTIGAVYIDLSAVPLQSIRFRVVLSSTSAAAGKEAVVDLYDTNGILNSGVPAVVAGSEIDTTTGSPPPGGPATDPLFPSAYEVGLNAAFSGYTGKGVFECRLRINVADAVNVASCQSADLLFETS
jgi:hypothetical protein